MRIKLAYGRSGLEVDLPDRGTVVVTPTYRPGVADPSEAVRRALHNPVSGPPLADIVHKGQRVAIAMCDGTRPQPRHIVIPVLLEELAEIVSLDDVVLLVATGTHRANTDEELEEMLGAEVLRSVRVVNHDARDDASLSYVGTFGADVPVWLNREWVDADVRITTGFVEPHIFAGFSGGPKLVAPGLAGLETTLVLHDARRIGDPNATWGIVFGNPVHDDVRAVATGSGVDFSCDVVLNRDQEIVAVFGGELLSMHAAACALSREVAMQAVPHRFDVVVTTNSGFPLDQNLYQTVKGLSAAAEIVRPGGLIVAASECSDGFPDHGFYRDFLTSAESPQAIITTIKTAPKSFPDQWQLQIQARIQAENRVAVHADGLSARELAEGHFESVEDIGALVEEEMTRLGESASCCVLPEGPQTVPYVSKKAAADI